MVTDRFTAMGSSCSIEMHGPNRSQFLDHARTRICELELLWSRFLPTSDVSRVNAGSCARDQLGTNAMQPVNVDAKTIDILQFAVDAAISTNGIFNPLLGDVMIENGYDRSFSLIAAKPVALPSNITTAKTVVHVSKRVPSRQRCSIHIDPINNTVAITSGISIDLGGVAKGFTADLVADELIELGAEAVMIDMGGDIACRNGEMGDVVWRIVAEHPADASRPIGRIDLRNGGVATSSTLRRRWSTTNGTAHHVMDPRTESSTNSDVIACSVAADTCANAEVLTKVLLCNGTASLESISRIAEDVLLVDIEESVMHVGAWRQ